MRFVIGEVILRPYLTKRRTQKQLARVLVDSSGPFSRGNRQHPTAGLSTDAEGELMPHTPLLVQPEQLVWYK